MLLSVYSSREVRLKRKKQPGAQATPETEMRVSSLMSVWAIQKDPYQKETKRRGQEGRGAKGKKKREGGSHPLPPPARGGGVSSLAQSSYARALGDLMTGLTPSADLTPHRGLPR